MPGSVWPRLLRTIGSGQRRRSPARKVAPRRRRPRRLPMKFHARQMTRLPGRTARRVSLTPLPAGSTRATRPPLSPRRLLGPAQSRFRSHPWPRPLVLRPAQSRLRPNAASAAGVALHIGPRGSGDDERLFVAAAPTPRIFTFAGIACPAERACATRAGALSRGARGLCTKTIWDARSARRCLMPWTRVCSARSAPGRT